MADYRVRIFVDPSGAVAGSQRATKAVERIGTAVDHVKNKSVPGLMGRLQGLGGAIQVAAVVTALGAYMRLSDGISTATAQLRLATRTQEQLNKAQRDAYAIAQKQGVAYTAIATLLAKTTKAATAMGNEMGRAQELGANATAAIAAGIKVSGTSSAAATAGILQLSQALSSGVLRGDELNSVMENIPAVGDAIAKQMGITTGELRKMGAEGKLTSEAVISALEKARPELERLADMIPLTFGAAFEKVKNAAGRLLTEIDKGNVGFGSALIAGVNLVSSGLDFLASHASAVASILSGVLVAAAVKTAVTSLAAGVAARQQAAANEVLALSALSAARAQHAQALAALAVARTSGSLSQVGVGQAAANVTASGRALAAARGEAQAASTALGAATTRASLFGRALTGAATLGRAALALVGGPIGVVIAALVGVTLWAGKAALSFQPIAGEAGTVSDYIMEAFSMMGDWVGKVAGDIWKWMKGAMASVMKGVRAAAVWYIDAWVTVGRAVAGVAGGIVAAFAEAANQAKIIASAMAMDIANIMSGNFDKVGQSVGAVRAAPGAIAGAYRTGYASGAASLGNVSGESVVRQVEALPGQAREAVSDWAKRSGLRDGANKRAKVRADSQKGGAGDPGNPGAPTSEGADKDGSKAKAAAEEKKKTFLDILDAAKEEARLASLTTGEQEVQNALASARVDLNRKLTEFEEWALTQEVKKKQENAANLALAQATQQVIEDTASARLGAAAEEARMRGDFQGAAALESELKVQQMLNQAKRDGVTLDQKKVEAYRAATLAAAQENEMIRLQQEAKRALQAIADNARKAMQTAVSDGIYAALSGDFKVGDFVKTIGNIIKRQIAETITAKLFGNQTTAQVDSAKATQAAVNITTPAAEAVAFATDNIVKALNSGAARIGGAANDNMAGPLQEVGAGLSSLLPSLKDGTQGWVDTLTSSLGPLGGAVGQFVNLIGSLIKGGGSSGGGLGGIGGMLGKTGIGGAAGRALGKMGAGAQTGAIVGAIGSMISSKFSQTGSMVGGALGSLIPGAGPLGQVLGSVLGGVIGGLLKKTPKGTGSVSKDTVNVTGNTADVKTSISGFGTNIQSGISKIASALGAQVGNYSVGLGKYKDYFQVSSDANDPKLGQTYFNKKSSNALYDGLDEAEAIRIAILHAISEGAIKGIREGTQRLLKASKDLDAQLAKALAFENVFKRLKQWKDPVGAAVDAVDAEFSNLKEIFKEAGASAAEYADLEELYGKERAKAITDATKETTKVLSDFLAELKGGALGGASMTDRVGYQNQLFSAIEQAQREGKTVDYDQVNTVGRALLDATRELEGATPAFYDQVNRVMAVLEAAIASGSNPNVSTLPAPLVFRDEVTTPVVASIYDMNGNLIAGFQAVVNALNAQTTAQIRSTANDQLSGSAGNNTVDSYSVANF